MEFPVDALAVARRRIGKLDDSDVDVRGNVQRRPFASRQPNVAYP
jgi:hypothetical protein